MEFTCAPPSSPPWGRQWGLKELLFLLKNLLMVVEFSGASRKQLRREDFFNIVTFHYLCPVWVRARTPVHSDLWKSSFSTETTRPAVCLPVPLWVVDSCSSSVFSLQHLFRLPLLMGTHMTILRLFSRWGAPGTCINTCMLFVFRVCLIYVSGQLHAFPIRYHKSLPKCPRLG